MAGPEASATFAVRSDGEGYGFALENHSRAS